MGWTFYQRVKEKSEMVARILDGQTQVEAHKLVGNNLWCVWRQQEEPQRLIVLFMLRKDGGWGYKSMGEEMGPYECNCPLEFLDLAPWTPEMGECSQHFRERVRAYHGKEVAS